MAKKSNGTKALVVGTMLGLVAGAAYALWKTPMSGKDLRSKLSTAANEAAEGVTSAGAGLGDKVMHAVETTLAPIVGVELGKTASGSQSAEINSSETGPITVPEPASTASNGHHATQADYGATSIRAQRYSWGTPAPEATKAVPVSPPAAPVEPAKPAATTEAVVAAAPQDSGSIRAQRYSWGTPAPEAAKVAPVSIQVPEAAPVEPVKKVEAPEVPAASAVYGTTSIRAQRSAWSTESSAATAVITPVANETISQPVTVNVEETTEIAAVAVHTPIDGMHPFPKLGGLE